MKYPLAIEWGDGTTAIGVHIPDLDISSAGDTYEEAYNNAVEVAHIALQDFVDQDKNIPIPSSVEKYRTHEDYKDMGWGLVEVDVTPYLGSTEKLSVTLPRKIVASIDEYVKIHNLKSRSAFLAETALEKISNA